MPEGAGEEPQSGRFVKRHRRALFAALGAAAIVGFIDFVLPRVVGLGPTVHRLRSGNSWWIALGVFLEALCIGGGVVLLRGVSPNL